MKSGVFGDQVWNSIFNVRVWAWNKGKLFELAIIQATEYIILAVGNSLPLSL
jgi:hypothetical protein